MKNSQYIFILFLSFLSISICSCNKDSNDAFQVSDTGVGGSYARFMIVGDFLYVVDNNSIQTFNLNDTSDPQKVKTTEIGSAIESIFNLDGKLFIGSGSGLYIYTIDENGIPQKTAEVPHDYPIYPCDPVVATQEYAYVTLNTTQKITQCSRNSSISINVLKIFDISNINEPNLLTEYQMTNPKGVGIDGDLLFLCDDEEGLKIYDVSDPLNIQQVEWFNTFTAYDVIPLGGLLLVVGPDNIYEYDYSDVDNIVLISTIPIKA